MSDDCASPIFLRGASRPGVNDLVDSLANEDLFGQLLQQDGKGAFLSLEGGDHKLDWVDGVEKALSHPEWLATAETEAATIVNLGIRHVIWSGMGGSVQTIYTLKRMGFLDTEFMTIHPCDSTDPASLNRILLEIAENLGLALKDASRGSEEQFSCLREILSCTMMMGVSMGMTSEEPITHLEWFDTLLHHASFGVLNPRDHIQVMTLPGSFLDDFARPRGCTMTPIQLDERNSTPGRMSAPATRIFIRPIALVLIANALLRSDRSQVLEAEEGELLRRVLQRCQDLYGFSRSMELEDRVEKVRTDPFVRLGAFVANEVSTQGRNKWVLVGDERVKAVGPWIEQIVEESLGKNGKGFLVFYGLDSVDRFGDDVGVVRIHWGDQGVQEGEGEGSRVTVHLTIPVVEIENVPPGLPELAALFAGIKWTVVSFAYLQDIVFAGQPAVEAYKKYAKNLREADQPVAMPTVGESPHQASEGALTLYYGSLIKNELIDVEDRMDPSRGAVEIYANILIAALAAPSFSFRYLDFTFNGEVTSELRAILERARTIFSCSILRIPGKIRTGPSDYHSTEQSETDGPNELVSTRIVATGHEEVLCGAYSDKFLLAQARGTWQAMEDAGRWIVMIGLPTLNETTLEDLRVFFERVASIVASAVAVDDQD